MDGPIPAPPVSLQRERACAVVFIGQKHGVGVLLESVGADEPIADKQFNLVDPEVASDGDEIVATDEAATVALVPVGGVGHPEGPVCLGDCEPAADDTAQHRVQVFAPVIRVGRYHASHTSTANRSPARADPAIRGCKLRKFVDFAIFALRRC
jgi:hypothetical protein